ncbi:hypothetical protein C8J56DRAFT_1046774 [Mycena floridula]|nr:hypothetical protein C8J56DRAFT_1046774 [Mycena floridula]
MSLASWKTFAGCYCKKLRDYWLDWASSTIPSQNMQPSSRATKLLLFPFLKLKNLLLSTARPIQSRTSTPEPIPVQTISIIPPAVGWSLPETCLEDEADPYIPYLPLASRYEYERQRRVSQLTLQSPRAPSFPQIPAPPHSPGAPPSLEYSSTSESSHGPPLTPDSPSSCSDRSSSASSSDAYTDPDPFAKGNVQIIRRSNGYYLTPPASPAIPRFSRKPKSPTKSSKFILKKPGSRGRERPGSRGRTAVIEAREFERRGPLLPSLAIIPAKIPFPTASASELTSSPSPMSSPISSASSSPSSSPSAGFRSKRPAHLRNINTYPAFRPTHRRKGSPFPLLEFGSGGVDGASRSNPYLIYHSDPFAQGSPSSGASPQSLRGASPEFLRDASPESMTPTISNPSPDWALDSDTDTLTYYTARTSLGD